MFRRLIISLCVGLIFELPYGLRSVLDVSWRSLGAFFDIILGSRKRDKKRARFRSGLKPSLTPPECILEASWRRPGPSWRHLGSGLGLYSPQDGDRLGRGGPWTGVGGRFLPPYLWKKQGNLDARTLLTGGSADDGKVRSHFGSSRRYSGITTVMRDHRAFYESCLPVSKYRVCCRA